METDDIRVSLIFEVLEDDYIEVEADDLIRECESLTIELDEIDELRRFAATVGEPEALFLTTT